jgi:hypothetical protein
MASYLNTDHAAEKLEWNTPEIRSINAKEAEDGSQANVDASNTAS